ncbi:MAG: hypothetical protein ABSG91_22485 [Syntrophobacteraceae bacterium]|jgi:hypothetical protein
MNLRFLGDALDHWKGSIFEQLERTGVFQDFAVDPMASDGGSWQADDWKLFARLLRINPSQIIMHQMNESKLIDDRQSYFSMLTHRGDLFLDPDTGIATCRVNVCQRPQYLMPQELVELMEAEKERIVAVYQHIRAKKTRERLEEILEVVRTDHSRFACCSYESGTVAMIFFSQSIERIQSVKNHFRSELGRHASGRINLWNFT